MPLYEASLVLRSLPKSSLTASLEQLLSHLYTHNDAFLHRIRFLGQRRLPQKKRPICDPKAPMESEGNYFLLEADFTMDGLKRWNKECQRHSDLLLGNVVAVDRLQEESKEQRQCTSGLDLELLSPAKRPSVQKLIEQGRKKPRFSRMFNDHTGLGYSVFKK